MPVRHVTLTPNVVSTVSVAGTNYDNVGITHEGNVTPLVSATTNGVDPVADADDTYNILSGTQRSIPAPATYTASTGARSSVASSVKLLCTAAARVEVEFG
jgi:hypothetical protein